MQRQFQRIAHSRLEAGWHFYGWEPIRAKKRPEARARAKVPQVCGEPVGNVYHGSGQSLFGQPSAQR